MVTSEYDDGVRFDPESHRYWIDDQPVRSVTTILSAVYPIPVFLLKSEDFQISTEFGTRVHEHTEADDIGMSRERQRYTGEYECADRWQKFVKENDIEILAVEMILGSREHMIAGTIDRLIRWDGQNIILDLKTSKVTKKGKLQVSGYTMLALENGIEVHGAMVVSLRDPLEARMVNLARGIPEFKRIVSEVNSGRFDDPQRTAN